MTFIYAIQSPSLPCGHLCGHSGAALRILARTHTEKPPSSDGGFSVSYRQLRTQADSHRNRASHFADLCLTTWLRRRRTANLMCDNKFRNQVDAVAPYGLTAEAGAWGTASSRERRTYLASWTVPASCESSR